MSDERFREQELDRFWDEVVRSPRLPVTGEFDLAAEDQQLIRRFQTRAAMSPPDAVRARVRRDVLSSFGVDQPTAVLDVTHPATVPNGRTQAPSRRWPRLRFPAERRRWLIAQVATALLLIITLIAIWLTFRPEQHDVIVAPEGTPTSSSDSSMFRGGPAHTGEMPGPGPEGSPVVKWKYKAVDSGRVESSPAIVDGVLYVGIGAYSEPSTPENFPLEFEGPGAVIALDAETSTLLWRTDLPTELVSSPAVADGRVYVTTTTAELYALDAATGNELWHSTIAEGVTDFSGSPTVVGDTIYVSNGSSPAVLDGVVFDGSAFGDLVSALDASTGELRWRTQMPQVGIYALKAEDGAILWHVQTLDRVESSPAVANGLVFAGDNFGTLHAIDAATGEERWQQKFPWVNTYIEASPAVAKGVVYVGSDMNGGYGGFTSDFIAFDAQTGEEVWHFSWPNGALSSPVVVDGVIYFGSLDHHLYALDAESGAQLWAMDLGDNVSSSPAVVDGTLYVGTGSYGTREPGYVYAITGSSGEASSEEGG
jgi:outer membrane protein assembly factor BamB